MRITANGAWLDADLPGEHRALSWAVYGGGFTSARRVSWRQVTNADLPPDLDPSRWLADEVDLRGEGSDIVLLTSRQVSAWERSEASVGEVGVQTIATVGLSNALRTGYAGGLIPESMTRPSVSPNHSWGTINLLCCIDRPLSDAGLIEAMSVAAEARTLAIVERRLQVEGGDATGTGTDCIVVASPACTSQREAYAGKHTAIGQALGRAVYEVIGRGADRWLEQRGTLRQGAK